MPSVFQSSGEQVVTGAVGNGLQAKTGGKQATSGRKNPFNQRRSTTNEEENQDGSPGQVSQQPTFGPGQSGAPTGKAGERKNTAGTLNRNES